MGRAEARKPPQLAPTRAGDGGRRRRAHRVIHLSTALAVGRSRRKVARRAFAIQRGWGGNEYAILADPGLQRHFIWRAAVSGRQRPLADFRRHADRQPLAWVLLPPARISPTLSCL